jgi:hypothetical protein
MKVIHEIHVYDTQQQIYRFSIVFDAVFVAFK